ncbi:MAG: (Fe-S)-binding protein [Candidatus Heimdallarchaeota archaeon]
MLRCPKCGFCRSVLPMAMREAKFGAQCPSGERWKFESYYASGRTEVGIALLEGRLKWTDKLNRILFACPTCGLCDWWCENISRHHPLKMLEELRKRYVEELGPLPGHKRFLDNIEERHNAYVEPHEERFVWMPEGIKPPAKADVMYFVGCTSSYREIEIAQATVEVLDKLGVDFGVMWGEEWCCGSPAFRTGNIDVAKKAMQHNLDYLKKIGAKTLITECPGCYRAFKDVAAYDLPEPEFEILHVTELIEDRVKELAKDGKLKKIEEKWAYHDPCHLGRHMMVYEPPRNVLKAIPGLELLELPRNRQNAWCCGSGGGVKASYPDFAIWAASERLDEVDYVGTKSLTTPCPFCRRNLRDASVAGERRIEVRDVMEILLRAL